MSRRPNIKVKRKKSFEQKATKLTKVKLKGRAGCSFLCYLCCLLFKSWLSVSFVSPGPGDLSRRLFDEAIVRAEPARATGPRSWPHDHRTWVIDQFFGMVLPLPSQ
jgi:hypothetical protein